MFGSLKVMKVLCSIFLSQPLLILVSHFDLLIYFCLVSVGFFLIIIFCICQSVNDHLCVHWSSWLFLTFI